MSDLYQSLAGKRIVLGITGGIAAYRALDMVSGLIKRGAEVRVVMTKKAALLIGPLSFAAITGNTVITENQPTPVSEFTMGHIALADWGDALCVVPATANIVAKAATGIADDTLSTLLLTFDRPVLFAPAMNTRMWNSPPFQRNLRQIQKDGRVIIEPAEGRLACGDSGKGRLAAVDDILLAIEDAVLKRPSPLSHRKIIVTAGRTIAAIDPVRFISNHSSGKMGLALVRAARKYSNDVVLIRGRMDINVPSLLDGPANETNAQMLEAIRGHITDTAVLIMAAAPVDFTVTNAGTAKLRKEDTQTLTMAADIDILKLLSGEKMFKVGFALETDHLAEKAKAKLRDKSLDLIVGNTYITGESGFDADTNTVTVFGRDFEQSFGRMSKEALAYHLLDLIAEKINGAQHD